MSFQGDVAGIGLAELLQSISRGRREGILHLSARDGTRCTLGLSGGILYLLPEEGEDPARWKERARQAWISDPDFRIDMMRMSDIARAHRIERLYTLLDGDGAHFRFDPGPLPDRPNDASRTEAGGKRLPSVHCEGVSVEFLLLEYARLSDELAGLPAPIEFSDLVVPRPLDLAGIPEEHAAFYRECDATSSIAEIADRLAWPVRQCRLVVATERLAGRLRLAHARELLVLAQQELSKGHLSRAAARLCAWVQCAPPGPITQGDAELLHAEWRAERMPPLLNLMPSREARILVRRLDHAQNDPELAVRHWRELLRLHRHDPIVELHRVACEARASDPDEGTPIRELLELARGFRERDHPRRAAAVLRLAAARVPNTTGSQLEVGQGMLAAGLVEEAAPWILEAARTLVEEGAYDKAIPPLRALLDQAPRHREARQLLSRARNLAVRRRLVRKHSLVGLAILLAMAVGGYVQIRVERDTDRKLTEIANLVATPAQARALLAEYFPGDDSPQVQALRQAIEERQRTDENALRAAWYGAYKEAQLECTLGDPLLGLRRALDLEKPPELELIDEPWPLRSDLFNGIAARLEDELAALPAPSIEDLETVRLEDALRERIGRLLDHCRQAEERSDTADLVPRLEALASELETRANERARLIAERDKLDQLNEQDMMLAAARAHAQAGDSARALDVYERLCNSDPTGRLRKILADEIAQVAARHGVLSQARRLAEQGLHEKAIEHLRAGGENPSQVALPWTLSSFPDGASVRFADGTLRRTPLVLETRLGQRLELTIEAPLCEPVVLSIDAPQNRSVHLSRSPERRWSTGGIVEAPPVAVEGDQVVCDRAGRIARLGPGGRILWERELSSLAGVARAPVFLPRRPGKLVLITEDGDAWTIDALDGTAEGPLPLGAAPVAGPAATADAVLVELADGRTARFERRLAPTFLAGPGGLDAQDADGSDAGLAILRRGAERPRLESPWTQDRVEIREGIVRYVRRGETEPAFEVAVEGEWNYVAFEAPHARLPGGRLWLSDGSGLRSFVP